MQTKPKPNKPAVTSKPHQDAPKATAQKPSSAASSSGTMPKPGTKR